LPPLLFLQEKNAIGRIAVSNAICLSLIIKIHLIGIDEVVIGIRADAGINRLPKL